MAGGKNFEFRDLRKTSLGTYLREISKIPLLTREQEVEIATRARAGDEEALKDRLVTEPNGSINLEARAWAVRGTR